MSSSSSQKCTVCDRTFGFTLWKHTCDVCRRTVCDDCAPRNTESTAPSGETTKLRVCKSCAASGRCLNDSPNAQGAAGHVPRVDPNSAEERERRAQIIEERNKSQQKRGRPVSAAGAVSSASSAGVGRPTTAAAAAAAVTRGGTPSPAPAPPTTPSKAPSTPPAAPAPEAKPATTATTTAAPANAARPTNPALEAALRRQQQQQQTRGGAAAAGASGASMSPEKTRLLREIEALMAKHSEEPPFGLRASDETKLKSYHQYLKGKYHVST